MSRIYRLSGAEARFKNVHLADEGHDFGINKRKAAYDFLAEHFGLDRIPIAEDGPSKEPEDVAIEHSDSLHVWTSWHHRPGGRMVLLPPLLIPVIQDPTAIAQLTIKESESGSRLVPLMKDSYMIGRHPDNPIQVGDPAVSDFHARLWRMGLDGYMIYDHSSRYNGLLVNGVPTRQVLLEHGDRVRIGETELLFEVLPRR